MGFGSRVGARLGCTGLLAVLALGPVERGHAAATCDDAAAVQNARLLVETACHCGSAASARSWRSCVKEALAGPAGEGLSLACARLVRTTELRSTCGRDDRVTCCRTNAAGVTKGSVRPAASCRAPAGGSACVGVFPHLVDACTEDGCRPASICGNGSVEPGEGCDPPDGTICSEACTSCPAVAGEIALGCTAGETGVAASATDTTLLVAYTEDDAGGASRALARRFSDDGTLLDDDPLVVSAPVDGTNAVGGSAQTATSRGSEFYVGWTTFADFTSYFAARRVPASGAITSQPDLLDASFAVGQCRVFPSDPRSLAPRLVGNGFHATWRIVYACSGAVLAEQIAGVGDFFAFPPPGNTSVGPAPIVRGASDVAAIWWNRAILSINPVTVVDSLAASWVEPGTPTMISLSSGLSPVAPALAAIGDTFVAVWGAGNEVRAMRFTRATGPLDPDGGLLVATAGGAIEEVAAAADGAEVVIAWREAAADDRSAIRAIRLAADGTLPSMTPTDVATTTATATTLTTTPSIAVAANPEAALVAFTRDEPAGSAVRAVFLPD